MRTWNQETFRIIQKLTIFPKLTFPRPSPTSFGLNGSFLFCRRCNSRRRPCAFRSDHHPSRRILHIPGLVPEKISRSWKTKPFEILKNRDPTNLPGSDRSESEFDSSSDSGGGEGGGFITAETASSASCAVMTCPGKN